VSNSAKDKHFVQVMHVPCEYSLPSCRHLFVLPLSFYAYPYVSVVALHVVEPLLNEMNSSPCREEKAGIKALDMERAFRGVHKFEIDSLLAALRKMMEVDQQQHKVSNPTCQCMACMLDQTLCPGQCAGNTMAVYWIKTQSFWHLQRTKRQRTTIATAPDSEPPSWWPSDCVEGKKIDFNITRTQNFSLPQAFRIMEGMFNYLKEPAQEDKLLEVERGILKHFKPDPTRKSSGIKAQAVLAAIFEELTTEATAAMVADLIQVNLPITDFAFITRFAAMFLSAYSSKAS
jgi:hypothetical protein